MWSNASNHHSITRGVNKKSFSIYNFTFKQR